MVWYIDGVIGELAREPLLLERKRVPFGERVTQWRDLRWGCIRCGSIRERERWDAKARIISDRAWMEWASGKTVI